MIDKLAEKGVPGGLLREIRALVVVDKRARPGTEREADDRSQGRAEFDRFAHLHRRVDLARSRRPAAADSALGCARLVAESVDRGVLAGHSSALRTVDQRCAAAVAGAHRRQYPQYLLEL